MSRLLSDILKKNIVKVSAGTIMLMLYASVIVSGTDLVSKQIDTFLEAGEIGDYNFIWELVWMVAVGFAASFSGTYILGRTAVKAVGNVKRQIAVTLPEIPYEYFNNNGTGGMVNKLISDIEQIKTVLDSTIPCAISYFMTVAVTGCYIGITNVRLLAVTMVFFPLMLYISGRIAKRLTKLAKKRMVKNDKLTELAIDAVQGIEAVKCNSLETVIMKKMGVHIGEILDNECKRSKISSLSWSLQMFIRWVPMIICMLQILLEAVCGSITVGQAFAITILLNKMIHPMSSIPFLVNDYREALVSILRVENLLNLEREESGSIVLGDIPGTGMDNGNIIELTGVEFGYDPDKQILKGIDFAVKKGQKVALVGNSGGGKSTIFKLLMRYYDADGGRYLICGKDAKSVNLDSLRQQFAIVSQSSFLFPESVYENVLVGRPDATKEEVIHCCKRACLDDFIRTLENGYDTVVGENGCMLSGGQRQRLSIARALLKDAPIILLDEPTASLDEENERLIQQMIEKVLSDRTIIYIAHRLSTIRDVDKIFVLENGRIVQEGTHAQLMKVDGAYQRLYSRESGNV